MFKNFIKLMKDYFLLHSLESKSEAIDRALSEDLSKSRIINRTYSEKIMQFLYLYHGEESITLKIRKIVETVKSTSEQPNHTKKIEAFLGALLETSAYIFEISLPPTDSLYSNFNNDDLIKYYEDNDYDYELEQIHSYKKLLKNVFRELGYIAPEPLFILKNATKYEQEFLLNEQDATSKLFGNIDLVKYVKEEHKYIPIYKFSAKAAIEPIRKTHKKEKEKQNYLHNKNKLFYLLVIVALTIGFTESFLPFNFTLKAFENLGITNYFLRLLLSLFVGSCTFLVTTILFHHGSYLSFKNIFLRSKSRFFYDQYGRKIRWYVVLKNCISVFLAIFAALIITGLSYSFYSAKFNSALVWFFVIANFLGWSGLLANALMEIVKIDSLKQLRVFLKELLILPLLQIAESYTDFKKIIIYFLVWVFNIFTLTVMLVLSISVICATSAMFIHLLTNAVNESPMLAQFFSKNLITAAVLVAELSMGAFWANNLCIIINFIRVKIIQVVFYLCKLQVQNGQASNYRPKLKGYRKKATKISNILALILVTAAVINATGSASGYYNAQEVNEAMLWVATLLGIPTTILSSMISASIIAVMACLFSSVGGTIFPAWKIVSIGRVLRVRKRKKQIKMNLVRH